MSKPVVAIVGRPNVGKSTLFNVLAGAKISIVKDTPGVTRDRIYADVNWLDYNFTMIDTGGIEPESDDILLKSMRQQAEVAMLAADVIIFLVDVRQGLQDADGKVADMLRKSQKPVVLVVNKVDNFDKFMPDVYEFYNLGLGDPFPVSAASQLGLGDMLDEVVSHFAMDEKGDEEDDRPKIAIFGKPNVGKSSIINKLLGEERVIVSDIAGTTRDAIDTSFKYHGEEYTVIDTAGLRTQGRIYENVEKYSLLRTMRAIDRSDVCLLILDATTGIIEHDKHIASYAIEAGKPIIIVVNKWDTIENKEEELKRWTTLIRNEFQFMTYAPIVFLSALTKKRIHTLIPEINKVFENTKKEIKTSILNDVIRDAYILKAPPSYKGKRLKIYFVSQVSVAPPTFEFKVNSKGLVHFSYQRYLENKLRESFDLEGTPIVINFKNKGEEKM